MKNPIFSNIQYRDRNLVTVHISSAGRTDGSVWVSGISFCNAERAVAQHKKRSWIGKAFRDLKSG